MGIEADRLRDGLLTEASDDLAIRHQELADRQARGKDTTGNTQIVSRSLERVEALQDGVTYKEPRHDSEIRIADLAAQIIILMLDGEGAGERHVSLVLDRLDEIRDALPEEKRKFIVFRQGAPFQQTGMTEKTPTSSFDHARTIVADDHREAIETIVSRCDDEDHYGNWPPVQDGEVLAVIELNRRQINDSQIWVERIQRPVYLGEAPRNNADDPRFQ